MEARQHGISVSRPAERLFPGIPEGTLLQVSQTKWLEKDDFDRLAAIPGTFFAFGLERHLVPAAGNIAFGEWTSTGRWPDPLYIPVAQRHVVEEFFGSRLDPLFPPESPLDPIAPFKGLDDHGHELRLLPFQAEAVRRLRSLRRGLLRIPTGRGKTACALALGNDLLVSGRVDRVVVAAGRLAIRKTWLPELRRFLAEEPVVVEGAPSVRRRLWPLARSARWVLTRYDTWPLPDGRSNIHRLLGPRTLVVIDEVHHFKNPTTKRWRVYRELLETTKTEYRAFLTATLHYDTPVDSYAPVELLGLHVWNTAVEFEDRYFNVDEVSTGRLDWMGRPQRARVVGGLKSPERAAELARTLDAVSFHRSVGELGDPTSTTSVDQVVPATDEEEALYGEVVRPVVEAALRRANRGNILPSMTIERLFSDDPVLLLRSDSPTARNVARTLGARLEAASPGSKMRALIVHLANVVETSDSKAAVYSSFVTPLERVAEVVENPPDSLEPEEREAALSLRGRLVLHHGGMGDREQAAAIDRFLADPSARVLLSTDSGSESLNLQSVLSYIVHLDEPLSLGKATQRDGRAKGRIGQTRPVHISRLILDSTDRFMTEVNERADHGDLRFVDVRVRDLLAWKKAQRDLVTG